MLAALALVAATFSSASARDGHPIHGSATVEVEPGGTGTVTSAEQGPQVKVTFKSPQ